MAFATMKHKRVGLLSLTLYNKSYPFYPNGLCQDSFKAFGAPTDDRSLVFSRKHREISIGFLIIRLVVAQIYPPVLWMLSFLQTEVVLCMSSTVAMYELL